MQSKNKAKPTASERLHIARIKAMSCIICDASAPSECHEINQGQWFTSMVPPMATMLLLGVIVISAELMVRLN